jgi:carbonic anhydrase/acetyltransferase-like protein (isoleucine patch superfamily)
MIHSLGDRKVVTKGDYWVADNASIVGSVVLEHNASVWFNTVVRGDNDVITIGECSNIQDNSVLHTDDGCLIGIKATILNQASIGRNCLIGAHTLITEGKEIPDRSLVMGVPGKVIRQLTDEEVAQLLWTADHYVRNFQRYKRELMVQT